MRLKRVGIEDLAAYMERLDVDDVGLRIMAKKGEVLLFEVRDMSVGAANILKQDALSVGADLAVPKGVVTCSKKLVDGLLMATPRQLEALAKKEMAQPFGLRELGKRLRDYLKKRPAAEPKVMGVVNATDDSFYAASRFMGERAVEAMERMIGEGAAIIDVGGMSSRPGSDEIPEDEELARIKPIVDAVYEMRLYEKARFSIDTYRPKVAAYALERGFSILNDITALSDDETARVAAANGAAVVLMHMKGRPKTMQQNPCYDDVVAEVAHFFGERIERAEGFGIGEIILDPGIGFGKRLEDNLLLLRDLAEFLRFGRDILVGASRKSMIDAISPSPVERRLGGTLAIHLHAVRSGAGIVRCHDVYEHVQALRVDSAIRRMV
jgi:dihydropteroate synthase